jgi:mannose-6-phosphate isomerase-like protein (cupin superfamily)
MSMFVKDRREGIKYWKCHDPNYIYSISVVILRKSDRIPYHMHEVTHTYFHKVEGDGKIIINNEERKLSNKFFIPPETPHTIRTDKQLTFICLEIPPDDYDFTLLEKE